MCAFRSSSRSRAFSRSSFRTFFSSRFPPEGFGPRFLPSSRSDPSRAAFRHPDRCELYSPSRRSRRPISPGVSQASAFSMTDSLYAAREVGWSYFVGQSEGKVKVDSDWV